MRAIILFMTLILGLFSVVGHAGDEMKSCDYSSSEFDDIYLSKASSLILKVEGLHGNTHVIQVNPKCSQGDAEFVEGADITFDSGFVQSFASPTSESPAILERIAFKSYGDAMSGGTVEPVLSMVISNGAVNQYDEVKYLVTFKWDERIEADPKYGESFLYFDAIYSVFEFNPETGKFELTSFKQALKVDRKGSTVNFKNRKFSLETPELAKQNKEEEYANAHASAYGQSVTMGGYSVDGCKTTEASFGEITSTCTGDYEYVVHGSEVVGGRFQCNYEFHWNNGHSEVTKAECGPVEN